jgi:hypothetical protein
MTNPHVGVSAIIYGAVNIVMSAILPKKYAALVIILTRQHVVVHLVRTYVQLVRHYLLMARVLVLGIAILPHLNAHQHKLNKLIQTVVVRIAQCVKITVRLITHQTHANVIVIIPHVQLVIILTQTLVVVSQSNAVRYVRRVYNTHPRLAAIALIAQKLIVGRVKSARLMGRPDKNVNVLIVH